MVGDTCKIMCSGKLCVAAEAATAAAAAARLRWRREARWDPRFLLLVLEVLVIKFNARSSARWRRAGRLQHGDARA